eukprot:scaffold4013_cov192-Ochromonas_danica.AAC.9
MELPRLNSLAMRLEEGRFSDWSLAATTSIMAYDKRRTNFPISEDIGGIPHCIPIPAELESDGV